MKVKVFAIYDSKVEAYMQPFFSAAIGSAIRVVVDSARPDTLFGAHPADFTLFHIGEYDDATGTLTSLEAKMPIGTILELKPRAQVQMEIPGTRSMASSMAEQGVPGVVRQGCLSDSTARSLKEVREAFQGPAKQGN